MDFILANLLTLILFTPVLGAVIVVLLPEENKNLVRWTSFTLSFIPLILSLILWFNFDKGLVGFQFEQQMVWYWCGWHLVNHGFTDDFVDPVSDPGFFLD